MFLLKGELSMDEKKKQLKMSFVERAVLAWDVLLHGLLTGGKEVTTVDKINEASRIRLGNYDKRLRNVVMVLGQARINAVNIEASCRTDANVLVAQIEGLQAQIVALNESKEQLDKRFTKAAGVRQKISDFILQLESNTDFSGTSKA